MLLSLKNISKKYRREWIFKNISCDFLLGNIYGLSGYNGSGKSTLLKIISGQLIPSKGEVQIIKQEGELQKENFFREFNYIAPYVDLIEEYTIQELIQFLIKTGIISKDYNLNSFLNYTELKNTDDKFIKDFSSGMKQKLKLGIGLLSKRPILILDEPTTNLDQRAKEWFYQKLNEQKEKLILIASNEKSDLANCSTILSIEDYKN
ncbi:MAG: hypothetical protein RIR51_1612 [Bacteroidota bacterium]